MEIWTSRDPSTHPSIMFPFLICNVKCLSMKYLTSFMMQASYFVSQGFRRRDERSNMLLVCEDACCYNFVLYLHLYLFYCHCLLSNIHHRCCRLIFCTCCSPLSSSKQHHHPILISCTLSVLDNTVLSL